MLPPQKNQGVTTDEIVDSWEAKFTGCPRTVAKQYENWYIFPDDDSVIICPACFDASIRPTPYGKEFKSIQRVGNWENMGYSCDFGDLIIRMAWSLTLFEKNKDPSALDALRTIFKDRSLAQCPNLQAQVCGTDLAASFRKTPATCNWYTIADPDTGRLMTEFTICPNCTKEVEFLLKKFNAWNPSSEQRSEFVLANPVPCEATCDFIHGDRMWQYLCALLGNTLVDFRRLAELIKERARLPECRENTIAYGTYIALDSATCLTACEECIEDIIKPDLERGAVTWDSFTRYDASETGFYCSLKAPRVRQLWAQAMEAGPEGLALFAREDSEASMLAVQTEELITKLATTLMEAESMGQRALMNQQSENNRALCAQIAGGFYMVRKPSRASV